MDNQVEPSKAVAWAISSMVPARGPLSGSLGYSVSACRISYDGGQIWRESIKASRLPNRTAWRAGVEAIVRVIEISLPDTDMTIYVTLKQLSDCHKNGWINKDGRFAEDYEVARAIYCLAAKKKLNLKIEYGKADRYVNNLKVRAKMAAAAKDALLTPAERRAVPAAKGAQPFNQLGGFPPIDEDDESKPEI